LGIPVYYTPFLFTCLIDLFCLTRGIILEDKFPAKLNDARRNPLNSAANGAEGRRINGRVYRLRIRIEMVEQIKHFGPKFE